MAHPQEARPPVDPQTQPRRQEGARGRGGRHRRGEERDRGEDAGEGVEGCGEEGEVCGEEDGRQSGAAGVCKGERRAAEEQSSRRRSQQTDQGGHVHFQLLQVNIMTPSGFAGRS